MRPASACCGLVLALWALPASGQVAACRECAAPSLLAVTSLRAPAGSTVKVPVTLSDAAATPLGAERGSAARIGGFAWRVRFVPASAVLAARVLPAADIRQREPLFESSARTSDGVAYLLAFGPAEIAAARPSTGEETLAVIELTLAPRLAHGSRVELRLDPATATLSNAAGTLSETVASGHLRLKDGVLEVE